MLKVLVNIILYLQYFGGFVLVLLFVGSLFGGLDEQDTLVLPINISESHSFPELEINSSKFDHVSLKVTEGELHFTPDYYMLWWLIIVVLGLGVVGYTILITLTVRKFFQALDEGEFFSLQNARQLRILAILVVMIPPLEFLGDLFTNLLVKANFELEGIILTADFNFMLLFVGLVLLVFSELFKIGAKLKEEVDYTV